MTKTFRTLFLTLSIAAFAALSTQAQGRIATVDLTRVFDNYYMTKESKLALQESNKEQTKELETLVEKLKKMDQEYRKLVEESNDQAVSAEERQKRKKALEPKLKELKEADAAASELKNLNTEKIKQQMARMMEKLVGDIKRAVEVKAKSSGYSYVLDSSARSGNQTEFLLFNSGENDLTDSVLSQLNAAAPIDPKK
jgi:Skp family chaperone for outer membrane proteins